MDGPRTVKEFLLALRSAGYSGMLEFHHDWVRNSSVVEHPEFDGLEALAETSTKSTGSANVPSMAKWFSVHQKSEAFVLKQMRLWSEEKKELAKKK